MKTTGTQANSRPTGREVSTEEARTWPLHTQCNLGPISIFFLRHIIHEIVDPFPMIHGYTDEIDKNKVIHIHYRPEDVIEAHNAITAIYEHVAALPDITDLSGDAYRFENDRRGEGYTQDRTGSNLPPEEGPWTFLQPLQVDFGEGPLPPTGIGMMSPGLFTMIKEKGVVLRGHCFTEEGDSSSDGK